MISGDFIGKNRFRAATRPHSYSPWKFLVIWTHIEILFVSSHERNYKLGVGRVSRFVKSRSKGSVSDFQMLSDIVLCWLSCNQNLAIVFCCVTSRPVSIMFNILLFHVKVFPTALITWGEICMLRWLNQ